MNLAPFLTPAENARRTLRELDAPIVVESGAVFRDTCFVLSPRFAATTVGAAFYFPAGLRDWRFDNCVVATRFQAWDSAWVTDPLLRILSAFRMAPGQRDFTIRGLHLEGFPEQGITASGQLEDGVIERLSIARCIGGVNLNYEKAPSRNLVIDGLRTWAFWGDGVADRGRTGRDGFAGSLDDSVMRNLELVGPAFCGLKLWRSKRVRVFKVLTHTLMVQGTLGRFQNTDGTTDGSEDITIDDLVAMKRLGMNDQGTVGFQVSFNVRGLLVTDFVLLGDGCMGHGIQCWGGVEARFRRGVISGWNRPYNASNPAHACDVGDGSSVNADFESLNRFPQQDRILRVAR